MKPQVFTSLISFFGSPVGKPSLQIQHLDGLGWNGDSHYTSKLMHCTSNRLRHDSNKGYDLKTWVEGQQKQQLVLVYTNCFPHFFFQDHPSQQLVHQSTNWIWKFSKYTTTVLTAILSHTNCLPPWQNTFCGISPLQ